jgi:tetratricopeptide (TPR) repeat protein
MTRKRICLGLVAALALAAGGLFGGLLADSNSARPVPRAPEAVAAGELLAGFSPGDTAVYARALEQRLARDGDDARALTLLGLAYQQLARESGDPSFYGRSEVALARALRVAPRDHIAVTGLAAVAASRHRFREALGHARRAVRLSPSSAAAYGVLGDALIELGRYEEAFAAFDRMGGVKPTLAAYARVAYARELLGRTDEAVAAMKLAVEAGAGVPEHAAWTLVQLGNLYFNGARLAPAAQAYRGALARVPGYAYADAGLARVAAARGDIDAAVRRYRRALERVPLPEFAVALADTSQAAGRLEEAREAERLVTAMQRLLEANGVRTELETALFDLDRGRRLEAALARAREAFHNAPSIHAEDVLAWALFKNGRCTEARMHSIRALRLGTRDALMHYHRGLIERCLGKRRAGDAHLRKALALNPFFSPLHARVAGKILQ